MTGVPTATPPPAPKAPADAPLSPEQLCQLEQANQHCRKALGAAHMATFDGWAAGIFAAISLPFALIQPITVVISLGLGIVAWTAFRGRRLVRRFDPRGYRLLGLNQLALMGLVIGYSLWGIAALLASPSPYEEQIRRMPQLKSMLAPIDKLHITLTLGVYVSLIVLTVLFQGLTALYYFTRTSHLRAYLEQTPPWVVDIQRRSSGL